MNAESEPDGPLLVACLCAAWCRTCDDYLPTLKAQRDATPRSTFRWVDIEDEEDALGDVDIENFPTVLIARGDAVLFFGTITPQPTTLARLVQAAQAGELAPVEDAEIAAMAARVRGLPEL